MKIHVFLGPTLPVAEAETILAAEYHPPARAGDVAALVSSKPAAIGIVDGFFEHAPAVRHKEILFALSRGIRVFGASSMGALRAAELADFGMEGVGVVFEAFKDGTYEDDDEVTVVHGPAELGYPPFSEAMVNLRGGLRAMQVASRLSLGTHDRLVALSKARFYPDRSWQTVLEDARELSATGPELDALRELARVRPSAKRDDAKLLLARIEVERARGMPPHRPTFTFAGEPWIRSLVKG